MCSLCTSYDFWVLPEFDVKTRLVPWDEPLTLLSTKERHSCGCTGCVHSQQSYYNKNTCKCKCFVSFFLHFENFALLLVW
ncbi:hypothetical protein DK237_04535 [Streptococcus suis]|nr:hypothetical protein DK237_04535 [Streptococcus suis]QLL49140.1 hypothetical protein DK875_04370 [Streptococcus suis]QLL53695.1 hypothetical protein DK877_07220 [Streptococcus suis]QLL55776.1 hypothetical protein DK878_07105 [Streptococcus suis]RRR33607.1 hypothetical protein EI997_09265 [Streptococcus suis]